LNLNVLRRQTEGNLLKPLVQVSVSVRVEKEDEYSHPDLEFWTYGRGLLIANGD